MVPEGWNTRNLGDLITYKKGFAFTSTDYSDSGVRIIRISDTTRDSVHSESPVYIPNEVAAKLDAHLLSTGDILLTTVGSRPHLIDSMVGKAIRVPLAASGSLLNQNLVKLIPIEGQVTTEYLFEILRKPKFRHYISTLVRGNANQVSISLSDLFKYKALMPNVREQKKIAQILSTWDKAITTTEQLLANSQQQKKALMQQLLTGKKRLLDENGVRFSGEWKDTALSEMGRIVSGGTPDTKNEEYWGGSVSWLTPTDVTALKSRYVESTSRTITEKGVKESSATLLPPRSLMVCTRATVGAAAISASEITTNQGFKNLIPSKKFDVEFIYYLIAHFNKKLTRKASGSTFLELSKRDFEKTTFECPSLQEQMKISEVLADADQELETLNRKLSHLKCEKQALMQQLLTGKRRVKLDREVA
ncbi:restriction endonuclease subunit S [Idiomarina sp. HP20-50]|uniref:restriction endonuclease subunit S n=1 Tax=Idiomarina sp. HP20-50 TaxID=3070813 RepID=UPI00294B429F|nr:restriction endonuclease subunit S [Idiomarina sp. HP20-50]MDV6314798.1 restriction endonuclease subunit S [Idiomarina sp. HP20-50]